MTDSLQVVREHLDKQSLASYVKLDGKKHESYEYPDLLVNMLTSYHGSDFRGSHIKLHEQGSFMLNPRQFWDFRKLIKSRKAFDGNGKIVPRTVLKAVEDEIFGIRTPYRAEWLNAKFVEIDGKRHINYDFRAVGKDFKPLVSEPLEECLMQDGYVDIRRINRQGMFTKNFRKQEVFSYYPRMDSVVRFDANSVGAFLGCNWNPQYSGPELGVRRAKILEGQL